MNTDLAKISFMSIGGVGSITRNMYIYENETEILVVDCGIGFPDRLMPGVDLLIPDISYLKNTKKKIVGMILTHGHEDHIGALPFVLPSLPFFPIYGSRLTSALANEKLKDFGQSRQVETVDFSDTITLGSFKVSFVRVTHSIIDAANLFIRTQVGNFYHASDFKFDFTPVDNKPSELIKIAKFADEGILCLFSDCLGSQREGHSISETNLNESFDSEFRKTAGKIIFTTYSSNISRLNQAIKIGIALGRKICFVGRSLLNAKEVARRLNYISYPSDAEIRPHEVKKYDPAKILLFVAGSQAQEASALVRIANGEDKDIKIGKGDTVIFSSDPIPGNELSVSSVIDTMLKAGAKVVYSDITSAFHVSGHGSSSDLKLMISLTHPKFLVPISGNYKHMVTYKELAKSMSYKDNEVFLTSNGQKIVFSRGTANFGEKIKQESVFVDQITGEALENYVLIDRLKISKEGIIIIIAEIDFSTGELVDRPDILTRGLIYENKKSLAEKLYKNLSRILKNRNGVSIDMVYYRKLIEQRVEELLFQEGRSPLVVPVILEL